MEKTIEEKTHKATAEVVASLLKLWGTLWFMIGGVVGTIITLILQRVL